MPRLNPKKLYFILEAANVGHVPVTVSSHGIVLPGGLEASTIAAFSDSAFPCPLSPGTSCKVFVEIRPILQRLQAEGYRDRVKLVPYYRDQTSKTFKGKPLQISVSEWLANPHV